MPNTSKFGPRFWGKTGLFNSSGNAVHSLTMCILVSFAFPQTRQSEDSTNLAAKALSLVMEQPTKIESLENQKVQIVFHEQKRKAILPI